LAFDNLAVHKIAGDERRACEKEVKHIYLLEKKVASGSSPATPTVGRVRMAWKDGRERTRRACPFFNEEKEFSARDFV
jgi:hypothetical protein